MNPTQVGRTHAGVRVLRANRLSPVGVVVVVLGRGDLIVVLVVTTTCRSQLLLESSVVGLRAVVLQPASDLRLLGLLTAAPHGVDPLQRRSGAGTGEISAAPVLWSWFVAPTVHGFVAVRPSRPRAAAHVGPNIGLGGSRWRGTIVQVSPVSGGLASRSKRTWGAGPTPEARCHDRTEVHHGREVSRRHPAHAR